MVLGGSSVFPLSHFVEPVNTPEKDREKHDNCCKYENHMIVGYFGMKLANT